MKESNWYHLNVCVKCENVLSTTQKYYTSATCPHCGHSSRGTVCDTRKVVIKSIKNYKWWQIFNRKTTYVGRDDFSKKWLETH